MRMHNNHGRWKPTGDQLQWACRVCANEGSLECIDCKCETSTGFEFSPRRYLDLCQEIGKERFFFDGEKCWCIAGKYGDGKIAHLERMLGRKRDELETIIQQRDLWKEMVNEMIGILKDIRKENQ